VISLAYYLRVVAAVWMAPAALEVRVAPDGPVKRLARVSGWSPEAEGRAQPEVLFVAVLSSAAVIVFGIIPSPLLNLAGEVGSSLLSAF
jgi:NADH-quinone oxidoreductase subunit N